MPPCFGFCRNPARRRTLRRGAELALCRIQERESDAIHTCALSYLSRSYSFAPCFPLPGSAILPLAQVIGARRASWRIISSIEQKEESKGNEAQVGKIKNYRSKVEAELADVCNDILGVLDQHLIPSAQAGESKVFYHKM